MSIEVGHYTVLGLPSGEEGARLSQQEINKAYRSKARELHPDKRRDDPNAHANFLKLQTSYEVLKDEKARKLFDARLRVKREKLHRQGQEDSKRRKMMSDLEERERSAFVADPDLRAREEDEKIARKLKEEVARIRAMHMNKMAAATIPFKRETVARGKDSMEGGGNGLDSNPFLVFPLQPTSASFVFRTDRNESDDPKRGNLVGAGYQAFEESVLDKLMKKGAVRH